MWICSTGKAKVNWKILIPVLITPIEMDERFQSNDNDEQPKPINVLPVLCNEHKETSESQSTASSTNSENQYVQICDLCVTVKGSTTIKNHQPDLKNLTISEQNKVLKQKVKHLKKRIAQANEMLAQELEELHTIRKLRCVYESESQSREN